MVLPRRCGAEAPQVPPVAKSQTSNVKTFTAGLARASVAAVDDRPGGLPAIDDHLRKQVGKVDAALDVGLADLVSDGFVLVHVLPPSGTPRGPIPASRGYEPTLGRRMEMAQTIDLAL